MCGIAAILSRAPARANEGRIDAALRALQHRGPDGMGRWSSPDGRVTLGHVRLSIIDLRGGAQPMTSEDGQIAAVVSGEFYDFERLRADLQARGHTLRSASDSEVLIHLYEERGPACLTDLRGEFAFILWDHRDRLLFAGRDRFGVRPLCYAVDPQSGALLLASEAKGLLAAGVPAAWDPAAVYHAAHLQYLLPHQTLFAGIAQVPPGHLLLSGGAPGKDEDMAPPRPRLRRYFDLDYPPGEPPPLSPVQERDATAQVRAALEDAVRLRLRADVPVACQLSGGLDSSLVAALAARALQDEGRGPLPCFCVRFTDAPEGTHGDAPYDEGQMARAVAEALGPAALLHEVPVRDAEMADLLPDAVAHGEGLAINGHLMAKFLLSRAIRGAGYKVALTGEGADEVFAGYPHLRQDLLMAEGDEAGLRRLHESNLATAGIQLPEGDAPPTAALTATLGAAPSFLVAKGTLGRRVRALLAPDFLREMGGRDPYATLLAHMDVSGQLAGRHPVHQALYLWTRLSLAGYILRTLGDGMEMAHAVEGRLPFLDTPLFALARGLPVSMKIRRAAGGLVEKYVLREAARGLVPDVVLQRQKHPFMAPPLAGPRMAERVADTLRGPLPPFFDRQAVRRFVDRLPGLPPRERVAADAVVMMVLCACLLAERFRL
jgi:asparagine synthase (glutamine-hydrolysing)